MRTTKKLIVSLLIAVFMTPLLTQGIVAAQASTSSVIMEDSEDDGWRTIKTDIITVLFPAGGRKPMFLWWYNKEPDNIYVVKFDGLTEHFTFNTAYYRHMFDASDLMFKDLFEEFKDEIVHGETEHARALFQRMLSLIELRRNLVKLREVVDDITKTWGHPAYLPFSGCKWTLQNVGNITADDDKIIGLTFTFNLTRALPRFKFAENNVAIRVRFYNTTVTEDVKAPDGTVVYSYKVGVNEMKMDFIVKGWRWNLDLVQPLLERLESYGVKVPKTNTGLALGIHLASLNKTVTDDVEDDEFEASSTTRKILIENHAVGLSHGRTDDDETPIEIAKGLKEHFKLQFASDNQTLAGFFKFIASAMAKNTTGPYMKVPVSAAYRAHGATLRLFISYPYFNETLVHDPSIGVETPETTSPTATTPRYQVTVGGAQAADLSARVIPQILSTQLVILLVVVATAMTSVLLLARSRGRAVVLRSV